MSEKYLLVLGCGMQGKAALDDLYNRVASTPIVVVDGRNNLNDYLNRYPGDRVTGHVATIHHPSELREIMAGASVIVEALPPRFALDAAGVAVDVGVSLVSSMYYLDPVETDPVKIRRLQDELDRIHRQAQEKGIVILPEFGLDPGIDLVLGARALGEFDRIHTFNSYGTGLPVPDDATNPLKYKFSWSVEGVLRATRRPAKVITGGRTVDIPGHEIMSPEHIHTIEIDEFGGPLECYLNGNSEQYLDPFNLRGKVQEMGRYASRYPGHCAFWTRMVGSGFLDDEPIRVGDVTITPLEFTSALLGGQPQFIYGRNEADLAMVRADVAGWSEGPPRRVIYQLIDRRDMVKGFTAMQRTVGYTMGLGARMILDGRLSSPGLMSPVQVPYGLLEEGLKEFGMHITREELPWEGAES